MLLAAAPGLSPEVRTALFYSTIFTGSALSAVYGGIWMEAKGLSPDQIGLVVFTLLAVGAGIYIVLRLALA